MKLGSLCSGVGGLDLAVEAHFGATVVWQCEYDPACSKVLERHWPGVPNLGDLTAVDWGQIEPVDIICAGYPCQPFSHAGRRKGTSDERHLWPYVADAIRVLGPGIVVLENVAGHLSLGVDQVLGDLAGLGYDARWGVVRAADAGAPHRRARWFCVATDSAGIRARSHHCRIQRRIHSRGPGEPGKRSRMGGDLEWGTYRAAIRRWEHVTGESSPNPLDGRRVNPEFPRWMMGLPAGWLDGMTRTQALRAAGNAVCPQQAALALELITALPVLEAAAS